jgi:outer membrane receptor protein involved in Fe transport
LWRSNNEYVLTTTQNFGEATWSGIDLAAAYRLEALGGSFAFNLLGTHMLKREVNPVPGNDSLKYDCVGTISEKCFAAPKNRATVGVNYDSNEWWSVGARARYFSGVEYIGTADKIAKANMSKAQTYLDVNASFRFMDGWDASVGISNVTDKEPPMVGDGLSTNANTIAGFYDSLGRYLFAEVTARF